MVPIHKKGDKQIFKNYRPISLLPITGKTLERLLYDRMFQFLTENNLISDNQSGFKPGDKTKVNKTIGSFRKLQNMLPQGSLLIIFKSFCQASS